jgi:hypothetical protein
MAICGLRKKTHKSIAVKFSTHQVRIFSSALSGTDKERKEARSAQIRPRMICYKPRPHTSCIACNSRPWGNTEIKRLSACTDPLSPALSVVISIVIAGCVKCNTPCLTQVKQSVRAQITFQIFMQHYFGETAPNIRRQVHASYKNRDSPVC